MSIISKGISDFSKIENRIGNSIEELESLSRDMRTALVKDSHLIRIDTTSTPNQRKLITIDGAKVVDAMSHTDLVVVGASIAESLSETYVYDDETAPSYAYVDMIQHDSKNGEVASAVMSAQELAMLGMILELHPDHIAVIDGGWTSNLTQISIAFQKNRMATNMVYDFLLENPEAIGYMTTAIEALLTPKSKNAKRIIALSKSDSNTVWSDRMENIDKDVSDRMRKFKIKDRALASSLLESGEMLSPTYVDAGKSLRYNLDKWEEDGKKIHLDSDKKNPEIRRFIRWVLNFIHGNAINIEKDSGTYLWSAYFKPTEFTHVTKSLRAEFIRKTELEHPDDPQQDAHLIIPDAMPYISSVNKDIISNEILEPWCQYIADKRAKEVSHLARFVRNKLASGEHAAYFLSNYRT